MKPVAWRMAGRRSLQGLMAALRPWGWPAGLGLLLAAAAGGLYATALQSLASDEAVASKALAWRGRQLASLPSERRSGAAAQENAPDRTGTSAAPGGAQSEAIYGLLRLARGHHIELLQARYDWTAPAEARFGVLEVRLPMQASYEQVRAFMESVLSSSPNVAVRSLALRAIDDPSRSSPRVPSPAPGAAAPGEMLDVDMQLMVFIPTEPDARRMAAGPTKPPPDAGRPATTALAR